MDGKRLLTAWTNTCEAEQREQREAMERSPYKGRGTD